MFLCKNRYNTKMGMQATVVAAIKDPHMFTSELTKDFNPI